MCLPVEAFFLALIGLGMWLCNYTEGGWSDFGKWLAFCSLILNLLAYASALGCLPWTINSEIYPIEVRGVGNSLASTTNWVSNAAISAIFLSILHSKYGEIYSFLILSVFVISCFFFVHFKVPETRGKEIPQTIAEITGK